jgi:alpha-tubulin suppressor-like RCC1 family protein
MRPLALLLLTVAISCREATAPIETPDVAVSLALGARHSCALTRDGESLCWGDGIAGQLGDSAAAPRFAPVSSAGAHAFVSIAAGDKTTCALDRDGAAWCWGELPTGSGPEFQNSPRRVELSRPFVSLTVGRRFACGLTFDGFAYCWGENARAQLGVGDFLVKPTPTAVTGATRFKTLSAGFWHVCGLGTDGSAWCWGDNSFAALGTGDLTASNEPKRVAGTTVFQSVIAGSAHSCGIASTGATLCWGSNQSGQIGDGTIERRLTPTPVVSTVNFVTLRATRGNSTWAHTCGLTAGAEVFCWGWNHKGQLGSTSTRDACTPLTSIPNQTCSYVPIKVAGLTNVRALDAGIEHTCALVAGGQMFCWGENSSGQLGDGTGVAKSTPVLVAGASIFP